MSAKPDSLAPPEAVSTAARTTAETTFSRGDRPAAGLAVAVGGLVAGALDITYAMVAAALRGRSPSRVLQSVASGLLGAPSYEGGVVTAALGLALHFVIAVGAALVFVLASRVLVGLARHPIATGLVFGVGVYLTMNFVVLPLSAVPFTIRYTPRVLLEGFVSHALLVGLPIGLACRRWGGPGLAGSAPYRNETA